MRITDEQIAAFLKDRSAGVPLASPVNAYINEALRERYGIMRRAYTEEVDVRKALKDYKPEKVA